MIIKYEWEEADTTCGRYVSADSYPEDSEDISGLCSVTYKIGYIGGRSQCLCLISITDGLIMKYQGPGKGAPINLLLAELNSYGYHPINGEQLIRRIKYLHSS